MKVWATLTIDAEVNDEVATDPFDPGDVHITWPDGMCVRIHDVQVEDWGQEDES